MKTELADAPVARARAAQAGGAVVLYDGQCEICQAGVTWLKLLDRRGSTRPVPIEEADLAALHPALAIEDCLRELHVVRKDGSVLRGWTAVAWLARRSWYTWPLGALGSLPPFRWLGSLLYRWVAANRYLISKCRGGACRVASLPRVRRQASLVPFWSCYLVGLGARLPLSIPCALHSLWRNAGNYLRHRRKRRAFLDGRLQVLFLGGVAPDSVPLLFGEQFTGILYKGVLVDPGSSRMRRSLLRHLRCLPPGAVKAVVATHHHEEHVGNLELAARATQSPICCGAETAAILRRYPRLPRVRASIIGQPADLVAEPRLLEHGKELPGTGLIAYRAPGHCDDHMVLHDPEEKLLLAGDAFMGSYFSTPNPDVDSRKWIDSLERLLELDIETLVEGHGHLHTIDPRIAPRAGLVTRQDPREALRKKLHYLLWIREQIESGLREGLPPQAIEATCFPWNQRRVWESFLSEKLTTLLSGGHFSHRELIRSFVRDPASGEAFPTVFRMTVFRMKACR